MYINFEFMGMDFPTVVILMLMYGFVGWFYESTIFSIAEQGKLMNRGAFIGPYCPIYGVVVMFSLYLLDGIQSGVKIVLIAGLLVSAVEFVTSIVLEKLFHARYWDYSYFPLNIDGRVSVVSGLFFGIAILFMIRVVQPFFLSLVVGIPYKPRFWIAVSILIIFFIDAVFTTLSMCNLNRKCKELYDAWDRYVERGLDKINSKKESLDKFIVIEKGKKLVVKLKGVNRKFVDLETRYLKRFPAFTSTKYNALITKMKKALKKNEDTDNDLDIDFDQEMEESVSEENDTIETK